MRSSRADLSRSLLTLISAFGLLAACGNGRSTPAGGVEASIDTSRAAIEHLRTRYFAQDYAAVSRRGEALVARFPESAELAAWYVLGLARQGHADMAAAWARELGEKFPESPWSRFAAGALMWNRENSTEEVLEATLAAFSAHPEHPDFVWLRAESLRLRQPRDEAIAFLEDNALLASSPELLNVRASALFDKALDDRLDAAKREAALEAFAHSRRVDPQNVNAHYKPGWFLLALGRPAEAYPLLETAASLSTARPVQAFWWRAIVGRSDVPMAERVAELDASVNQVLDAPDRDPVLLVVAAAVYRDLDLPERKQRLEERVLAEDPDGRAGEAVRFGRLRTIPDEERVDALRAFLQRDRIHEPHRLWQAQGMLFSAIKDDPDVDPAELLELVQAMSRQEGPARVVARSEGATALATRKAYLQEAEQLAEAGIAMLATLPVRPYGPEEAGNAARLSPHPLEGTMRAALGWVRFNQGRVEDAERELLAAYAVGENNPSVLLYLGKLYESVDDFERAETYFIQCASLPLMFDHPCADVLEEHYERRHGTMEGFEQYLVSIRERLAAASSARVSASRLSPPQPVPPFSMDSLDGVAVSLTDLHGKFTVVKFWATWCGPCRVEMPEFVDFIDNYAEEDDVRIITVNSDPNPETAQEWMWEQGYDFEVLIDDGYTQSAQVIGIPTTWFLDERGVKVFEVRGVIKDMDREYSERIDMMRSDATS